MPPPPPIPDRTETLVPRSSSTAIDSTMDAGGEIPPRRERSNGVAQIGADDPDRYEQIAEHGRGGLGRVVRAVDRRLNRTVAVKELLRSSPATEARFVREALITARLEHPGIVPVHEAGRWPNGDPYYVMKLVEGRTLKELIEISHTLRERMSLMPHVIAIADAVGYAHSEGVIHRDLKPSNVIVGAFGETIVIDWGLARDQRRAVPEPTEEIIMAARQSDGSSTISGKVVGTPAYMAPEQARGELVDERADVYAIGAVLYEVLAGRPPHHDQTPQATLERVIAGPPCPVSLTQPHIPSELATIVSKAMARNPTDRYEHAAELADDLRRFTTGKLVSAHSYTAWSLLRKKIAQHRGVVAVGVVSVLALGAVGVESFRRVLAERNIARLERAGAEDARAQAERRQRELVLLQAVTSLRKDPTATLAWLKTYEIADADRAHIVDVVDEALALGVSRHVFRPGDWVFDVAFTPDGSTVVAAVRDGVVRGYDLRVGSETVLGRAESAPEVLAMSRDGQFVVTGHTLGEVILYPLRGGSPRTLSSGGTNKVLALSLSPDNQRVLVQRDTGAPQIYSIDGGAPTHLGPKSSYRTAVAAGDWTRQVITTSPNEVAAISPTGEPRSLGQVAKAIWHVELSPRGDTVLVHDGTAVWSVPYAGGAMTKVADYKGKIGQFVWSPDERTLALCGDRHAVILVDTKTQKVTELRGHTDAIYMAQWTRDGRRLLSASDDGTARVWTIADGTASVLRGHDDDVYRARFSADERQVVTASLDGSIRVWWVDHPGARTLVEGGEIDDMTLDGDRALVKTRTEVARWNVASGHREPLFSWGERDGLGVGVASPDGERLLVPTSDWSIEVRRRSGPTITLRGHKARISHVEFSRDSGTLYTSSFDGTLQRWNLETGEGTKLLEDAIPVRGFAVAKDNRVAAQVGDTVKLISPAGAVRDLGTGPKWCVEYAEFDKVRDRLVVRRCDQSAAMLDGDRLIELPTGNYMPTRIAVSPDGSRIAGAMRDRTVRLWDAATGQVLKVLRGHTDLTMDVAFSPDGTTLASASYDKTVRVWELATARQRVLRGHSLAVNRLHWQGADHIVTASYDGTLRVWDVPPMELPTIAELARRIAGATSARIEVDRPTTGDPVRHGT